VSQNISGRTKEDEYDLSSSLLTSVRFMFFISTALVCRKLEMNYFNVSSSQEVEINSGD